MEEGETREAGRDRPALVCQMEHFILSIGFTFLR